MWSMESGRLEKTRQRNGVGLFLSLGPERADKGLD